MLTEKDRADIQADLEMEERALERLDNTEALPWLVDRHLARRASCVAEIERLRAQLEDVA